MNIFNKGTGTTRKRYNMLALVFVSVIINYLDRTNISVAASAISKTMDLNSVQLGLLFSAFAWTYVALQIPGGMLVDRIKTRFLYSFMLFFWSIATLMHGFANSFIVLLGLRSSIGLFEAPSYPCNNAIVTRWFPENERASAIAIYTSGQFMGMAFLLPALTAIQATLGWRWLFFLSGAIGILWAIIWYIFYRDPGEHKTVSPKELETLKIGGALSNSPGNGVERKKISWAELAEAFRYRKLWGVYLGQFCLGTVTIFFLTWFPTYLVDYRGLDFLQSGFLASVPFLAAFGGVLLSGFISDLLVKKGYSPEISRKTPVLVGMLLAVSIIGANFTDSTPLIIFFLALAFFGNGLASIGWVFISLMAPKNMIGIVGGVFNFVGGLSAIIIPIVIGMLVKGGDFKYALFFIGAMTFLGFFSYLFIVGKVERIKSRIETS